MGIRLRFYDRLQRWKCNYTPVFKAIRKGNTVYFHFARLRAKCFHALASSFSTQRVLLFLPSTFIYGKKETREKEVPERDFHFQAALNSFTFMQAQKPVFLCVFEPMCLCLSEEHGDSRFSTKHELLLTQKRSFMHFEAKNLGDSHRSARRYSPHFSWAPT